MRVAFLNLSSHALEQEHLFDQEEEFDCGLSLGFFTMIKGTQSAQEANDELLRVCEIRRATLSHIFGENTFSLRNLDTGSPRDKTRMDADDEACCV